MLHVSEGIVLIYISRAWETPKYSCFISIFSSYYWITDVGKVFVGVVYHAYVLMQISWLIWLQTMLVS